MNDEKNKKYYLNNTSYIEYSMTTMDSKQHKELSLSFIQKYIQKEKTDEENIKNKLYLKTKSTNNYVVLKYNKPALNVNTMNTTGLFRSVIFKNGELVCFSPIKSLSLDHFFQNNSIQTVYVEEFVEGTMINCFFDKEKMDWQIATKSVVGAKTSFSKDANKTFKDMFEEAFEKLGLTWDMFSREYCYSMVLQHPENKIVLEINEPSIYLVDVFKIQDYIVSCVDFRNEPCFQELLQHINIPQRYDTRDEDYQSLKLKYCSMNTSYKQVGIMFKNGFMRYKIRNPSYEYLHNLKGNNPKIQYQYYSLRKNGQVKDFLKHYPEYKERFSVMRYELHKVTGQLWRNYLSCYVNHEHPLKEYGYQYRPHMIELHKKYINELMENKKYVSRSVVMDYMNSLPIPKMMFLVNYQIKQKNLDFKNNEFSEKLKTARHTK